MTSIGTRVSERQAPSNGDSASTAGISAGYDPSEHGVHHFHGLVLDACRRAGAAA